MLRNGFQPAHIIILLLLLAVAAAVVLVVVLLVRHLTRKRPPAGPQVYGPGPAAPAPDPVDQVRRLAELRDAGAISPEEYEVRKNRLLGGL